MFYIEEQVKKSVVSLEHATVVTSFQDISAFFKDLLRVEHRRNLSLNAFCFSSQFPLSSTNCPVSLLTTRKKWRHRIHHAGNGNTLVNTLIFTPFPARCCEACCLFMQHWNIAQLAFSLKERQKGKRFVTTDTLGMASISVLDPCQQQC